RAEGHEEWEGDHEGSDRVDTRCGQPIDERASSPASESGTPENKQKKHRIQGRCPACKPAAAFLRDKASRQVIRRRRRRSPLRIDKNQRAGPRPEAVGAVSDGLPERKVFK